jgi:hypothetical protein
VKVSQLTGAPAALSAGLEAEEAEYRAGEG